MFLAFYRDISCSLNQTLRPNDLLPFTTRGSAVPLDHSRSVVREKCEIQSGCRYGFVGRACREIPRSGSQRSAFLVRDLPDGSRPSCIISCIIRGRAPADSLSRVSETSLDRGSTRSGTGRNGDGRQDRVSAFRRPPEETESSAAAVGATLSLD